MNNNETPTKFKSAQSISKMATISQEKTPHRVLALYKFVSPKIPQDNLKELQAELELECRKYRARGTLLLAEEGINGTICYPFSPKQEEHQQPAQDKKEEEDADPLLEYLQSKFDNSLRIRRSNADGPIFARFKIKIKSEIVTLHEDACHPTEAVGTYVQPEQWNELLNDPDCLVVDTRNEYEIQVGTFRNAVNPHTESFTEFPEWMKQNVADATKRPKKIAMFCTGGIRCEKATNACQKLVPKDMPVYHLEGGILAYLDDVPPQDSLFDGECYVFDQRIAVTYGNQPSEQFRSSCHACRHPLSTADMERGDFVDGLSCQWCVERLTDKQKERFSQRQRQIQLARNNGTLHIHDPKEQIS